MAIAETDINIPPKPKGLIALLKELRRELKISGQLIVLSIYHFRNHKRNETLFWEPGACITMISIFALPLLTLSIIYSKNISHDLPIISAVLLPYIFFILYGFTEHVVIKDGICEYVYIHIVYIRFKVVDIISIERAIVPKIGYRGAQIYMLNLKIKCSDREQERFISIHNFSNKTVDNLLNALGYVRVKNEISTIGHHEKPMFWQNQGTLIAS